MPNSSLNVVQLVAVWALPTLFAITLHEVAHGWVAKAFGDSTAYRLGRLSLNPLRHIDPVGTVVVPALLVLLHTGFIFGWAKPVPVVMGNLRNPRRDMAVVAAAGPLANLAMALMWAVVLRIALGHGGEAWLGLQYMGEAGVLINIALMALNLIPLPPLDGGRIAVGILPLGAARALASLERYGLLILVALLATGLLNRLLAGPFFMLQKFVFHAVGLNVG